MIARRQLLRQAIGAAFLATGVGSASTGTGSGAAVVLVRHPDGSVVQIDREDVRPFAGALPSTQDVSPGAATPPPVPDDLDRLVTEGNVEYWLAAVDGDSVLFRVDTGNESAWWWRQAGERAVRLTLPTELEPALPTGTVARWFHGATIDEEHLGAGELRLLAVSLETGEIVLDRTFDRRLELAATTVSDDGSALAHVLAGNTGAAFWGVDLRGDRHTFDVEARWDAAPVAPSAIDLRVTGDDAGVLAAAGFVWDWPEHPEPVVHVAWTRSPDAVGMISVPGELIGFVPASARSPATGHAPLPPFSDTL